MEKKHQVFVSSTYKDLVEERREVMHALLELDCIPAGMELFPATDEDAWSLITEMIDGCDYYILILAGKYGSTNSDGLGYTEMEFDYAMSQNKPIISFVHENVDDLPSRKIEGTSKAKRKLASFIEKAKLKHCKFWNTAPDLGGKVSRSLVQLKKKHPSDGWVPGKYAADQKMLSEMERLRTRLAELELQVLSGSSAAPENIDQLEGGKDELTMSQELVVDEEENTENVFLQVTWDRLFSYCGPKLAGECTSNELFEKVDLAFWHAVPDQYLAFNSFRPGLPFVYQDQIIVQFQALGLMQPGTKRRAVSNEKTYWKLTPYGEKYLIQIRAKRKRSNKSKQQTAEAAAD